MQTSDTWPFKFDLKKERFWARAAYQDKAGKWHWTSPEPRCTAVLFVGESGYFLLESDCFHAILLANADLKRTRIVYGTYADLDTPEPPQSETGL